MKYAFFAKNCRNFDFVFVERIEICENKNAKIIQKIMIHKIVVRSIFLIAQTSRMNIEFTQYKIF